MISDNSSLTTLGADLAHLHVANLSQRICMVNTVNIQCLCPEKATQGDSTHGA